MQRLRRRRLLLVPERTKFVTPFVCVGKIFHMLTISTALVTAVSRPFHDALLELRQMRRRRNVFFFRIGSACGLRAGLAECQKQGPQPISYRPPVFNVRRLGRYAPAEYRIWLQVVLLLQAKAELLLVVVLLLSVLVLVLLLPELHPQMVGSTLLSKNSFPPQTAVSGSGSPLSAVGGPSAQPQPVSYSAFRTTI
jgi:hypothetical protein